MPTQGKIDLLQFLDLEAWGQGLLQLLSLLLVGDLQGVQKARTTDLNTKNQDYETLSCIIYLELNVIGVLLYLDALGILPPGFQEEILDLLDFTRHGGITSEST